jgi:hypothetical protein
MTIRTAHYTLSLALLCIAILFGYALSQVRRVVKARRWRRKRKREPIVPIVCEYPDDSEFWAWYNVLIAQADFSYDEARALYKLVDHAELHTAEETTTVEPDSL